MEFVRLLAAALLGAVIAIAVLQTGIGGWFIYVVLAVAAAGVAAVLVAWAFRFPLSELFE